MERRPLLPSQRLARLAAPGSLLKPISFRRSRDRRAVVISPTHRNAIRQLPCLRCGLDPCGECAHVRFSSAALGKTNAMGRKPSDYDCVPLCPSCHRNDDDSQHRAGELMFWHGVGLNPILICRELEKATPDIPKMRAIAFRFIAERESADQMRSRAR